MKNLDSVPKEVEFRLICDIKKDCYRGKYSPRRICYGLLFYIKFYHT